MPVCKVAETIVRIPRELRTARNVPIRALILASGYGDQRHSLGTAEIAAAMQAEAGLVDDWLDYSADKRTPAGWFVRESRQGWEVGFYGPKGCEQMTDYADPVPACAAFIMLELAEIWRRAVAL